MEKEQQFIIDTFIEHFSDRKDQQIVLYGIGKNTEAILKHVRGFHFIGLMDPNTEGQMMYGLPVLSMGQLVDGDMDGRIVVIIARDSVVNIIFKRIEMICRKNRIPVFDYKGRDLSTLSNRFEPSNDSYWYVSMESICKAIDDHDIISFDIFDTLLMRNVLYPSDVFELTELRLKKKGFEFPFARLRKESEKAIADRYPNLDDIYIEMKHRLEAKEGTNESSKEGENDRKIERISHFLKSAREVEEKTDCEQILVRDDMATVFRYAVNHGKRVLILSDMYYSADKLTDLLQRFGLEGFEKVLVSNEIKSSKEQGDAYEYLLRYVGDCNRKIFHIGDNRRADYEKAIQHGLDAFRVYSSYELLQASSLQELLVDTARLETRCVIGLFAAKLFQSPFALYGKQGFVPVSDLDTLGYCFIGPMMSEFVKWMVLGFQRNHIKTLLLPSRDGYLLEKVVRCCSPNIKTIYFRASRRAVTVAGIRDSKDIDRIASRGFTGTMFDFLFERFGVEMSESDSRKNQYLTSGENREMTAVLRDYEEKILENAAGEREKYLCYLKQKGITTDVIAEGAVLFDFVTSGTVLYHLSRLFQSELKGICFATMNLPNAMFEEKTDRLDAAYGNIRSYGNKTALAERYLILESVFTDERSSFTGIDDNGEETFEENGWNSSFERIMEVQEGILQYEKDHLKLYQDLQDEFAGQLSFADALFGRLFDGSVTVDDEIKNVFVNDDIYDGVGQYPVWK